MPDESKSRNWKQEPLVWLLIAIPAAAVVMGIVSLALAIQSYSGLVVDDYYQHGKQINRVLARDRFAHELGLSAGISIDARGLVEIRFDREVEIVPGNNIELALIHATRPGLDRTLRLTRESSHLLRGRLDLAGSGRWNLYLQTSDWRLTGSLEHPAQRSTRLLPNYSPG